MIADSLFTASDLFHLAFGAGSLIIGLFLLWQSRSHRALPPGAPLPPHLRFLQGDGMPQLLAIAAWLATLGGIVIIAGAVALMVG